MSRTAAADFDRSLRLASPRTGNTRSRYSTFDSSVNRFEAINSACFLYSVNLNEAIPIVSLTCSELNLVRWETLTPFLLPSLRESVRVLLQTTRIGVNRTSML